MRIIRFKPELIEKIKQGKKTMTFRVTKRHLDYYKVEEGNRSIFDHVDSGIIIQMTFNCYVGDVPDYIKMYFNEEGFDSPQEFEDCLKKLNKGTLPTMGFSHVFRVASRDEAGAILAERRSRSR